MEFRPATPDEREAVAGLLVAQEWQDGYVDEGETWIARDGDEVVGTVRLLEAGEGAWYVADVIVREDLRGRGIGSRLLRAAMASNEGGAFFLVCHPEPVAFYDRLGYVDGPKEAWPEGVIAVSRAEDDYDSDHDHLHLYLYRPATGEDAGSP